MIRIALIVLLGSMGFMSCHTAKKINTAIAPRDSVTVNKTNNAEDSLRFAASMREKLTRNYIDFRTFSAKIKLDIEDAKGKQPDLTANVRIIKDSAIWISISATFLNFEVYRVLVTRENVILLNKQEKKVQYRTIDYLQDVTNIPFDFKTLQDLFVGNPIFFNDSNAVYRKGDNFILVSSVGPFFKNLLTLSPADNLVLHSKLDDVDVTRNRTADVTYGDYQDINGLKFSAYRQVIASEQNKLDIRMNFKQVEFNKELSVAFSIPKNYKSN